MKIDLRDMAGGSFHAIRKIIEEISATKVDNDSDKLVFIDEGKEIEMSWPIASNTRLLLEILVILKKIDANVEKFACQTK